MVGPSPRGEYRVGFTRRWGPRGGVSVAERYGALRDRFRGVFVVRPVGARQLSPHPGFAQCHK
eukprot:930273-Lingulodinium_polyedra.AAC.1